MAVLRKEKKSNFTVIDNAIFKDYSLSLKAKGLLCQMLSLPDGWEYSVQGLARLTSDGTSAITSGLKELEQAGYFRRERIRSNNRLAGIEYIISETPNTDFLISENLKQENLILENQPQLNTKESITKVSNTKRKRSVESVISELPDELQEIASDYVEHRKQLKAPMTARALEMAVKKANELANGDTCTMIAIFEQSIRNGWKGVFALSSESKKSINPFTDMRINGDY